MLGIDSTMLLKQLSSTRNVARRMVPSQKMEPQTKQPISNWKKTGQSTNCPQGKGQIQ